MREGEGSAQSQPCADAQERSPDAPFFGGEFTVSGDARRFHVFSGAVEHYDWMAGEGYTLEYRRKGRGWLYRRRWWPPRPRPSRWLKTSHAGLGLLVRGR